MRTMSSLLDTCKLLDAETAAEALGVSIATVRRMIKRGELRATRVGRVAGHGAIRIHVDDMLGYLLSRQTGPGPVAQ
jgi:excisionase family DNA binding protein